MSASLGDGPRCSYCNGKPHKIRDCPACGTRREMEESIKLLTQAVQLYEAAIKADCCCNADPSAEEDDCDQCNLVAKARAKTKKCHVA